MAARAVMIGCVAAVVLGIAYVIIESGGSGPTLVPVVREPPVTAKVEPATVLGKGKASIASGGSAGLWVARQTPGAARGRLIRFRLPEGAADPPFKLDISPFSLAVGDGAVWVLGTRPDSTSAVLERIDPDTGKVKARTTMAEPPACLTRGFASCYPVVTRYGVWVPLTDTLVRVNPAGTMADKTTRLNGHIWDMTSDGKHLWAIAEVGAYRINERTGDWTRLSIKDQLTGGLQASHIVADDKAIWISAFPPNGTEPTGRLIHLIPGANPKVIKAARIFPGAGSLALTDGGLWLDRYDGKGELDRLNQLTGDLSGPFVSVPDDVIQIVPRNGDLWILSYRPTGNVRTVAKVSLTPTTPG